MTRRPYRPHLPYRPYRMSRFFREWSELRRFRRRRREDRQLVFYSEGRGYWIYFRPMVDALRERHGRRVCYVTSDPEDPLLAEESDHIAAFYVGSGAARTTFFQTLDAGVMVMTMPDLETFHIKRSVHPVHYAYVHHSLVSTHMAYRPGAFDHFDSILCSGPHHQYETREWERLRDLPPKRLFEHGYGPLDELFAKRRPKDATTVPASAPPPHVLIAPSWGAEGLFETRGLPLVEALLSAGYRVIARPHPRTEQRSPRVLAELRARFDDHPRFSWDGDTGSKSSMLDAHVMVSDWSGAALEFALGLEKPVLFVDVPKKVNNPEYTLLPSLPVELALREELGVVLAPDRLGEAPRRLRELLDGRSVESRVERIRAARERYVYNLGRSGEVGAEILEELVSRIKVTT